MITSILSPPALNGASIYLPKQSKPIRLIGVNTSYQSDPAAAAAATPHLIVVFGGIATILSVPLGQLPATYAILNGSWFREASYASIAADTTNYVMTAPLPDLIITDQMEVYVGVHFPSTGDIMNGVHWMLDDDLK